MALIRNVRVARTGDLVPAIVKGVGFAEMVRWQREIQEPYAVPAGGIGSDWHWPRLYMGCRVAEGIAGRELFAFQIRVAGPHDESVPICQGILTHPYRHPGPGRDRCVFAWFLAAAPEEALRSYGITQRFATLAPMLDTAIQISLDNRLGGRIGLHAAVGSTSAQSEDLAARYHKHGLARRPAGRGFFRWFIRKEDGRLFYFTERQAAQYAANQDDLR